MLPRGNAIQSMLMIVELNNGLYAMTLLKLYRSLCRIRFVRMYLSKIVWMFQERLARMFLVKAVVMFLMNPVWTCHILFVRMYQARTVNP